MVTARNDRRKVSSAGMEQGRRGEDEGQMPTPASMLQGQWDQRAGEGSGRESQDFFFWGT